jgi:hypothetical protein
MLDPLRGAFGRPLTEDEDEQLQRFLGHYLREATHVGGARLNQVVVMRAAGAAMQRWLASKAEEDEDDSEDSENEDDDDEDSADTEEGFESGSDSGSRCSDDDEDDDDPMVRFGKLCAQRSAALALAPIPSITPINKLPPALQAQETREPSSLAPPQPTDILQPQSDVIKYREVETNLILNSKDRDWIRDVGENRYNFSVQINGGAYQQGDAIQPTVHTRFRNIVRIEFVKAIIPVEGLTVVVPRTCPTDGTPTAVPDQAFYSALAMPFIQVLMDELQGNNVGTTDGVDRSLAICQYDATWRSDQMGGHHATTTSRGYTLFFPKFMKAQRIYAPTPLGSLQKMSFRLLNPENTVLSATPDAVSVSSVTFGTDISGSCYADASGDYIFLETPAWFPLWAFSKIDRIQMRGLSFTGSTPALTAAGAELIRWLENPEGHVVVGIAHTTSVGPPLTVVADGANDCGYANWIIIRNRFSDPTTGACSRYLFTGDATDEATFSAELAAYPNTGGAINLSRQVQLFLRIITRELDNSSIIRPDNV